MELSVYLRFFFALIFTLSLIGILYWAIKRFDLLKFSTKSSIAKTLIIKETLRIDVRNKLIIVQQGSNEYLILVYYKDIGGKFDKLIGVGKTNSFNLKN